MDLVTFCGIWLVMAIFGLTGVVLVQLLVEMCVRAFVRGYWDERSKYVRSVYGEKAGSEDGK